MKEKGASPPARPPFHSRLMNRPHRSPSFGRIRPGYGRELIEGETLAGQTSDDTHRQRAILRDRIAPLALLTPSRS